MSFIPKPHEIYKHFKGNLYQITAVAEHTETGEQLVIYQAMYGDFKIFAAPLSVFAERVDREKYPRTEQEFLFELQGPDAPRQRAEARPEKEAGIARAEESMGERSPEAAREMSGDGCFREDCHSRCSEEEETSDCGDGEAHLDPLVLEFLDSDSYEEKLNVLAGLHHRITDEMITIMAIACDIEIGEGDTEERYEALKNCLLTLERYECNRLR